MTLACADAAAKNSALGGPLRSDNSRSLLLWAAFVVFALAYWLDPTKYHNQFGNLLLWVEAVMFGLPVAAVFVGFKTALLKAGAVLAGSSGNARMPLRRLRRRRRCS
jgi:hypothetical protein